MNETSELNEEELREEFFKDWSKREWYTASEIASKLKIGVRTIHSWNFPGLMRQDGGFFVLKMVKLNEKSARGEWVVDFLVERNLHGYTKKK